MKRPLALLLGLGSLCALSRADEVVDQIDRALTFSIAHDQIRIRASGALDLEAYYFPQGDQGLIYSDHPVLWNPRLSLFFDAQLGGQFYVFAQSRVDRGFDPSEAKLKARLDEYAVRYTPWQDGRLQLQVGQFATVVGNWVERHLSWDNPFIGAPLPYENLTAMWDSSAVKSVGGLLAWGHLLPLPPETTEHSDKLLRLPIIWGPSYATGAAVSGRSGTFEYAAEVKNASLSSRPETWSVRDRRWEDPTLSARLGYRPNPAWNFGLSASEGSYLSNAAEPTLAVNSRLGDYRQIVLAQDLSFAWHYLQLWAEIFENRFEVPAIGHADVYAYYVEAKYKFTPQFFGAVRWNQEWFGQVGDQLFGRRAWGRDTSRIDLATIFRLTENAQLKFQYSWQHETLGGGNAETAAAQLTLRF